MTKIAVIVFEDAFVVSGTTVRVHRVLELLNKKYNLTVITPSNGGQGKLKEIEVKNVHLINVRGIGKKLLVSRSVPLPVKLVPILLWNLRLAFLLLKNRFDIVYLANDRFGFLSACLVSKIRRYKTVFEAHTIFSEEIRGGGYSGMRVNCEQSLEKFVMKHADFIVALSQNTLEFYRTYNDKIDLVPVFVDTDVFKVKGNPERSNSKLIGLIGPFDNNMRQKYNLDFLYANIKRFDSRIRFVIIGRCEERIENDRITYTGHLDSFKDYIIQLSHLDAVLIVEGVTTSGPLNKIIEPMSCSLPVFTTPKGMVGLYYVEPGRNIFVFEEEELAEGVNALIFDDELMREIGRNARLVVEQYYGKRANQEKLIKIIELFGSKEEFIPNS